MPDKGWLLRDLNTTYGWSIPLGGKSHSGYLLSELIQQAAAFSTAHR